MSDVNSLSIIENTDMTSFKATMSKIGQFQRLVRENLQDGKDYGTIPGTSKPTLYKPGAEKILMLMGLQSTYEILDSTRDFKEGFFQYQVRCTLKKNEMIITQGLGACNSKEKKYERQSGFNIDNTILKMAKKRSQVDASLAVASLSEIFTQDLEDTGIDVENNNHQPVKKITKEKPASEKQIAMIEKNILTSHLIKEAEHFKIKGYLDHGITKAKASEIISWWIGDSSKFIIGERTKRGEGEKKKSILRENHEPLEIIDDKPLIPEEEGSSYNNALPFKGKRKAVSVAKDFINEEDDKDFIHPDVLD